MIDVKHYFLSHCIITFVAKRQSLPHYYVTKIRRHEMVRKISWKTRVELLNALRERYQKSIKKDKVKILDELVVLTGYHRKHASRLLGQGAAEPDAPTRGSTRRIYDEAVKEALIVTWEVSDRICGKRLQALLPNLVDALERHGHLDLNPRVRQRVLRVSSATIDRLLSDVRKQAGSRKRRSRKRKKMRAQVPVRTFADWNDPAPGCLEIDFVAHSGGSMAGAFIHTLVATDISSGWVECVPLLSREQSLVVEALEVLRRQLPFPVLKIDSDNDGAFINETLYSYCRDHDIEFMRSRPSCSNDQAWVEQKNGAVVRRFVGYERFSGVIAAQALAHLYRAMRMYINHFQPSFKLQTKQREGSKIRKVYQKPLTPSERLCSSATLSQEAKNKLQLQRTQLDPLHLLHSIRDSQAALAALVSPDSAPGPGRESLENFLAHLPTLWRQGEVRPTHPRDRKRTRYWRTRRDPFETSWVEILSWLEKEPDITATMMFERLQKKYPNQHADGQLRTLQRRVKEWRHIMARNLVFSFSDENPGYAQTALVELENHRC